MNNKYPEVYSVVLGIQEIVSWRAISLAQLYKAIYLMFPLISKQQVHKKSFQRDFLQVEPNNIMKKKREIKKEKNEFKFILLPDRFHNRNPGN